MTYFYIPLTVNYYTFLRKRSSVYFSATLITRIDHRQIGNITQSREDVLLMKLIHILMYLLMRNIQQHTGFTQTCPKSNKELRFYNGAP